MWYQHWFEYLLAKGTNPAMASMYARERADIKPSEEILAQVQIDEPNVVYRPLR